MEDQCLAYAKRTKHPEFKDRTIWEVFQEERPRLMELRARFDGFVETAVRATTTCLIMADHNRTSEVVDPVVVLFAQWQAACQPLYDYRETQHPTANYDAEDTSAAP